MPKETETEIRLLNPIYSKDDFRKLPNGKINIIGQIKLGKGIRALLGLLRKTGKSAIYEFIFPKSSFDIASAKEWIEKHKGEKDKKIIVIDIADNSFNANKWKLSKSFLENINEKLKNIPITIGHSIGNVINAYLDEDGHAKAVGVIDNTELWDLIGDKLKHTSIEIISTKEKSTENGVEVEDGKGVLLAFVDNPAWEFAGVKKKCEGDLTNCKFIAKIDNEYDLIEEDIMTEQKKEHSSSNSISNTKEEIEKIYAEKIKEIEQKYNDQINEIKEKYKADLEKIKETLEQKNNEEKKRLAERIEQEIEEIREDERIYGKIFAELLVNEDIENQIRKAKKPSKVLEILNKNNLLKKKGSLVAASASNENNKEEGLWDTPEKITKELLGLEGDA